MGKLSLIFSQYRLASFAKRDYIGHMQITLREGKAKLSELVERASGGEEVVITVRGHPKARLCPMDTEPRFSGKDFVRELESVQSCYRVRGKDSPASEKVVSELREDRL